MRNGAAYWAGEPGIGKTRLVSEVTFAMHGTGTTVRLGRCDEDLAIGYRPWTEALTPLVEALSAEQIDALLPEHMQELAATIPAMRRRVTGSHPMVELDAATRTVVLSEAIGALLRQAAPVVVVLDDIHWIDQSPLMILRNVLTNASPGVTIIGTYRDTDVDRVHPLSAALADLRRVDGVKRVALAGLDDAGVAEFVEAAAGHALDAPGRGLADAVHAQTSGNPLFVGEMLRHLAETGAVIPENDRWVPGATAAAPLPEGLREVIGRRLTRLGDDVTQTLRVGAFLGRSFDADIVDAVLGRDALDDIERAVRRGSWSKLRPHTNSVTRSLQLPTGTYARQPPRTTRSTNGQLGSPNEGWSFSNSPTSPTPPCAATFSSCGPSRWLVPISWGRWVPVGKRLKRHGTSAIRPGWRTRFQESGLEIQVNPMSNGWHSCGRRSPRSPTRHCSGVGRPKCGSWEMRRSARISRSLNAPTGSTESSITSITSILRALVICSYDRLLAGLAAVDGDHHEADRLFAAALAQEEALRSPPPVTRTKHWWGRALARRGEPDRARPLLDEARASAEQLGMRGVVTQIDDLTSSELFAPR